MHTTTPPTVLVLGATGRFGGAAVAAFCRAGWRVLAQRRPKPGRAAASAPSGVRWIDAEAHDTPTLVAAAGRADAVVHAMNPGAYTAKAWEAEAPALLDAAIRAARGLDALLMFPGNVYNFGARMPALLREDTPQHPTTRKGTVRVALERRLAEAARTHGLRSVTIRAGDFFGSGQGSLLDLVIARDLAHGRMGLPGGLHTATPWAYLPDLADTFVRVAERRAQLRDAQVLHFAGHALTGDDWRAVLEPMAHAAGWLPADRPLAVRGMPWLAIRLGGLVVPMLASLAEMRYLWTTPHALDNARLRALIGEEPRTPFPQAVALALAGLGLRPAVPAALQSA